MIRTAIAALIFSLGLTFAALAQVEPATKPPEKTGEASPPPARGSTEQPAPERLTDAERIIRLQRSIEDKEKRRADLEARLQDPESEYNKAEAEFKKLDADLESKKKELNRVREQGKTAEADTLETELNEVQQRWKLAKDRFDLAFQDRKTLREQVDTLATSILQDRESLNKLQSPVATQPAAPAAQAVVPVSPTAPTELAPGVSEASAGAPATPEKDQSVPAASPPVASTPAAQSAAPVEPPPAPPAAAVPSVAAPENGQIQPSAPASEVKAPNQEVLKAQETAQAKEQAAQQAQEIVTDIEARIAQLRKLIEQDRERLKLARQKVENASEQQRLLLEQVQKRSAENAPLSELTELWNQIAEARQRQRNARAEVTSLTDEIDKNQDEMEIRQQERIEALREVEKKLQEAERARRQLESISNPFAPRNLLKWGLEHGPKIGAILLGMFALLWLSRTLERRLIALLVGRGVAGTIPERENRARTLGSVFHNAARLVIIVSGLLMLAAEVGIDIVPLIGAAGVVGLAVAFGAQNLVRDYFAGFMILLENQYGINDVIKVGETGGLVERITLRITVLRSVDGTVHFIPNGQIHAVSNMTHGWSRALFDIGVAYKEDVDLVMQTLIKLGKELRADPTFRQMILDDPEMLGVDSFSDSAVVIRFFIKTRPMQQWTVKRAMLRRIKKKFDEMGIEIPFPHRTVYHRYADQADQHEESATAEPAETRQ